MGNFLILFYMVTAWVWVFRNRRALEALRENPKVEPSFYSPTPRPLVSILIPVKNEEENIEDCLIKLLHQDYSDIEIIVINDHSIDHTVQILTKFLNRYPAKVRILNAPEVPAEWTGKNWALAYGVQIARGDWFLFTDADTRHDPHSVSSAVAHAEGKDLDLLTLTPRCLTQGFWEDTLQAPAMTFLGLWFPFKKVNQPSSPIVFGNGQYFMIRRKAYQKIGGHASVREAYLEDFALVKGAKENHLRVECAIGTKIYGTRMYRSFSGIWAGWRRIFHHAFLKNPWVLSRHALSIFIFSFLPFFLFPALTRVALNDSQHYGMIWGAGFVILGLIFITAWKAHRIVGAPPGFALLHPIAGLILTGILTDAMWVAFQKKKLTWR